MKYRNNSVIKKMFHLGVLFAVIISGIFSYSYLQITTGSDNDKANREKIVALNEIKNLTIYEGKSPADEHIETLMKTISNEDVKENQELLRNLIIMYVVCMMFIIVIFMYIYFVILRPFQKLEGYAGEIAKGNFNIALSYKRNNMFGAFTWAFDHMRKEINKARSCEKEAIVNNKTVIATLSHDIKTPIASIRAYAEGLEANMDTTAERKERYLEVILRKCDEVTKLTDDLFFHSLSDLDKLQINSEQFYINDLLQRVVVEMVGDKKDIYVVGTIQPAIINADEKRMAQVFENIINNARKYACENRIDIWTQKTEEYIYEIHIKDHGNGILPEDMPFVFEKFYRGKNINNLPGAGLGLYIVKYIMIQMKGNVTLKNKEDGLEVILTIPVVNS